jgi:hypothetical protein
MKKYNKIHLLSLAVLSAGISSSSAAVLSLQEGVNGYASTTDTYVHNTIGDTNYGVAVSVRTDNAGQIQESLISFGNIFGNGANQIALGSTITSATLTIYTSDITWSDGNGPNAHRMLQSWDEGAVTWNSLSGGITLGTQAETVADDTSSGIIPLLGSADLNVTASLQAWSAGTTNNGWALIGSGTGAWYGHSSETGVSGKAPTLSITYDAIPEPSTTALLGLGGFALIFRRRK